MEIDVARVLGTVTRTVRNFAKDGRPAVMVELTRSYDTTPVDLWDALTNPERIPRWFLPVEGELKLGGRYQLKGNAGGTITECEPPSRGKARFAATWEYGGGVSWIEVRVAADGDRARITLQHTAYVEPHWDKFGPGAVGIGWDLGLMGLDSYLAAGSPATGFDPAEATAWMGSENGHDFVRDSGEAWRAAHVAAGADAGDADARSARTVAFYLGETTPEPPEA